MRLKSVTLKTVLGLVAILSILSGAALARRDERVMNGPRSLSPPKMYAIRPVGQHEGHSTGTPSATMQLAIDGSVSPNEITDERAYDHFLSAVASLQLTKGREVVLSRVGLNSVDRVAFNAALGSLNADLKSLIEQQKANRVVSSQAAAMRQSLLADARTRVRFSLSSAGREQLDGHIRQEVKRRIKIYRAPMPQSPEALQ